MLDKIDLLCDLCCLLVVSVLRVTILPLVVPFHRPFLSILPVAPSIVYRSISCWSLSLAATGPDYSGSVTALTESLGILVPGQDRKVLLHFVVSSTASTATSDSG